MQFLVVGSLWAFFSKGTGAGFAQIKMNASAQERFAKMMLLFYVFFAISGLVSLLLIYIVTPARDTFLRGLRRARKLGLESVPLTADAAPSLSSAVAYFAMTLMSYAVLSSLAQSSGVFFTGVVPWTRQLYPLALLCATMVYVQALKEYFGPRGFFGFLGIAWVVPMLLAMIVGVSVRDTTAPLYLMTPTPPAGFVYAMLYAFEPVFPTNDAKMLTLGGHDAALTYISIAWSFGFAAFFSVRLWRRERADALRELQRKPAGLAKGVTVTGNVES